MTVETPQNVATNEAVTAQEKLTVENTQGQEPKTAPSPAQDIRNIQMLLVSGIFPGQMAPQVVQSYQILDKMATKIEADAAPK